jgi:hypothetical protein
VKQGQVGVGALLLSLNPTLTLVANSEFGFKCLQSPCSEDGILRVLTRNPQSTGSKCTRNEFATSVNFAVTGGNRYPARCCSLLLSNCRVDTAGWATILSEQKSRMQQEALTVHFFVLEERERSVNHILWMAVWRIMLTVWDSTRKQIWHGGVVLLRSRSPAA